MHNINIDFLMEYLKKKSNSYVINHGIMKYLWTVFLISPLLPNFIMSIFNLSFVSVSLNVWLILSFNSEKNNNEYLSKRAQGLEIAF